MLTALPCLEAWDESNKPYSTVLGLIIGTGFGGGFVFDGKIHSGRIGMAGEVGHMQLNYHALKLLDWDKAPIYECGCGNQACLDTYISGRGFELLFNDLVGEKSRRKRLSNASTNKKPKWWHLSKNILS